MRDPFEPDWNGAPESAEWHIFDADGIGWYVDASDTIGIKWHSDGAFEFLDWTIDAAQQLSGYIIIPKYLDWRNSLRHRPETK